MTTVVFDTETKFTLKEDQSGKTFSDFGRPFNNDNAVVLAGTFCNEHGYREGTNLKDMLSHATTVVAHNAKYDLLWARRHGVDASKLKVKDTILRAAIIGCGVLRADQLALGWQAKNMLGTDKPDIIKNVYWKSGVNTDQAPYLELSHYLKSDVSNTAMLYNLQLKNPYLQRQKNILRFCEDIIPVLTEMEWNGVAIDPEQIPLVEQELKDKLMEAEAELYDAIRAVCGEYADEVIYGHKGKTKLIDSPKEMSKILFSLDLPKENKQAFGEFVAGGWKPWRKGAQAELDAALQTNMHKLPYGANIKVKCSWLQAAQVQKGAYVGKTGLSSNGKILLSFLENGNPNKRQKRLVEALLRYSKLSSWLNTNFYGTVKHIADDGFLHGEFNQTGTATLRLSCKTPNMQNIPAHDKEMPLKKMMVSRFARGHILQADYGQLEFRVVGELSGDTGLINDVVKGVDIHTQTSKIAFNMPAEIENKDQMDAEQQALRQRAKTKTFEFQYGAMPKTKIDQQIFDAFYSNYSILAGWQEQMTAKVAQTQEYVCPVTGKIFRFPNATWKNKGAWVTKLKNYGTQFLASMVTQAAMLEIHRRTKDNPNILLILQVHDSIVLDVAEGHLDEAAKIVEESMLNISKVFKKYFNYEFNVPMGVDMEYGISYSGGTPYKGTTNL